MATYKNRIEKLEGKKTVKKKFDKTVYMYQKSDGTLTIDGKIVTMQQARTIANEDPGGDVLLVHCHYEEGTQGQSIRVFEN